jgi:hypothetical protein
MSNVVSPRGPLPPRVYWRRRLVLAAVLVGILVLIGQLFGGGADPKPVADGSKPTPTSGPTEAAATDTARTQKQAAPRSRARRDVRLQAATTTLSGPTGPLAQPTGPCKAADVAVVPDVEDTDAYGPVPLRIGLSTTAGRACTFAFGPDRVAVRVTSGDDLIWESLRCKSALQEETVVVRPGWLSYVTIDWNGRRGSEGCGDANDYADPGYYWAEAAAIGGEPGGSQFELETPPKPTPEPSPKPSPEPSEQESPEVEDSPTPTQSPETDSGQEETGGEQSGDEKPIRTSKAGG